MVMSSMNNNGLISFLSLAGFPSVLLFFFFPEKKFETVDCLCPVESFQSLHFVDYISIVLFKIILSLEFPVS